MTFEVGLFLLLQVNVLDTNILVWIRRQRTVIKNSEENFEHYEAKECPVFG